MLENLKEELKIERTDGRKIGFQDQRKIFTSCNWKALPNRRWVKIPRRRKLLGEVLIKFSNELTKLYCIH